MTSIAITGAAGRMGQRLVALAKQAGDFQILSAIERPDSPAMANIVKPSHFRDLGNLMLAFVMLYAYTAFSEYLLSWYANLHEEIPHFIVRQAGVWGVFAFLIVVFHFFLPFFMLLMRAIKDRPATIGFVAIVILVIRFIAIYWMTQPSFSGVHFYFSWMTIAAPSSCLKNTARL